MVQQRSEEENLECTRSKSIPADMSLYWAGILPLVADFKYFCLEVEPIAFQKFCIFITLFYLGCNLGCN